MKKVYLTDKQYKTIKESISEKNYVDRFSERFNDIDTTNPLGLDSDIIKRLLLDGYNECKECFSDDIESHSFEEISNKLSKLIAICQKKEEPIREQLEKICGDVSMSVFNLDNTQLECNLVPSISNTKEFHVKSDIGSNVEYDSLEQKGSLDKEKIKRSFAIALTIGGAMELTDKLLKKCLSDIFELDEELPHLYNKVLKINNYLLYLNKEEITDKNNRQCAYEEVTLLGDDKGIKIKSEGILFPFLLTETLRGLIESMAVKMLPESDSERDMIIDACDVLELEPAYMIMSKPIWKKVINGDNIDIEYYKSIFDTLFSLGGEEFTSFMNEVCNGTKLGKQTSTEIINKSKRNLDYNNFEKDLDKKRKEKQVINDGYLTEDELDEANYPETFSMEEFKSINSYSGKIRYCSERLRKIASGSGRMVFQIDDNTVLKLAKNKKGVAQNEIEGQPDYYRDGIGLFAEVYDCDDNYYWIEMQLAKKAKPSDFQRLTGYPFKMVQAWCIYLGNRSTRYHRSTEYDNYFKSDGFNDNFDSYSIFGQLQEYIGNYDVPVGDLCRISSWGVVNGYNGEELVLVDYGLDNYVLDNYYR